MTLRDGSPIRGCPWESRVYLYPIQSFSFPPSPDVEPLLQVTTRDGAALRAFAERQTNGLRDLRQRWSASVVDQNAEARPMVAARADRAEGRLQAGIHALEQGSGSLPIAEATLTQNCIALDVLAQIITYGLHGKLAEHSCDAEQLIREATVLVRTSPHHAAALSELAATYDAFQPHALREALGTLKRGISRLQDPRAAATDAMPPRHELSNGLTRPLTEEPDPFGGTRASAEARWNELTVKIQKVGVMYGELYERSSGLCKDVKAVQDAYAKLKFTLQTTGRVDRRFIEQVHGGCDHVATRLSSLLARQHQGPASIHQG